MENNRISQEDKKALQQFAVAYYFVFRLQLENAELIEQTLQRENPQNSLFSELANGYIHGSVSEFVLLLYDSADLLKKVTGTYKYNSNGPMADVFRFRRHFLAHRACNRNSEESKDTRNSFGPGVIYKKCHEAAFEYSQDLQRYISFDPIENIPLIQKFRQGDFESLIRNSPTLSFQKPAHHIEDVKKFFGSSLLP